MATDVLAQAPVQAPSANGHPRTRVLLILPIGHLGGGPETVRLLAQHLDRKRFDVSVVCPNSPMMARLAEIQDLRCWALEFPMVPSLRTIGRLAALIRRERIDIVHSQLFHGDLYAFLATRLTRGVRLVSTIQGINFFWETERPPRRTTWWLAAKAYRLLYRAFDGIAACSEATKQAVCSRPGIKIPVERVRAIHNTIDVPETVRQSQQAARLPARSGGSAPRPRIITVANFDPVKGHQLLIEAITYLGANFNTEWWLVGDGPERGRIEARVRELGFTDRIHFLGYRDDVPALIQACDLFVFPSLWDGLGMAALEAMALGVPVVACAAGGIPEIIEDRVTGWLVPPGDAAALAAAIRAVLGDQALVAQVVREARVRVEQDHDARGMAEQYAQWYEELMAARGLAVHGG